MKFFFNFMLLSHGADTFFLSSAMGLTLFSFAVGHGAPTFFSLNFQLPGPMVPINIARSLMGILVGERLNCIPKIIIKYTRTCIKDKNLNRDWTHYHFVFTAIGCFINRQRVYKYVLWYSPISLTLPVDLT